MSIAEVQVILSDPDRSELRLCESIIDAGLATFVDVGGALLAIRDRKLYRADFSTFEAYCEARFSIKRTRAYELIDAAKVVSNLSGMPDIPKVARHATALARLPETEQAAAWDEAIATAPEGKVTAKVVQEVVDRKLGREPKAAKAKPEATPAPEGKSVVNGVKAEDPADVAKLRKQGKISADVIVTVTEPEPTTEDEPKTEADPADSLPDAEWLETLPLWPLLHPNVRPQFARDAIGYRASTAARNTFRFAVRSTIKNSAGRSLPPYLYEIKKMLKLGHPRDWALCIAPSEGGCGGTGRSVIGPCSLCHGCGYKLYTPKSQKRG
jgi:hypothetical protein